MTFLTTIVLMLFSSCTKEEKLYTKKEGLCYMPQAYQDRGKLVLLKVDSVQNVSFGFYYTAFDGAPADIIGNFEVDENLVEKYNELNAYTGNVYEVLPKTAYTVSGTSATVKKGNTSSEPLTLSINPKFLMLDVKYLLPVRLISVSSGTIDTSLAITYFKIDELATRSKDVTMDGTITGSHPGNGANEALSKLVDGDYNSKYLAFNYNSGLYVQLKFNTVVNIDAYTITSGNDAPERDPKDWNLQGSNDGAHWTTIDTRTGESFIGRNQTKTFNLSQEAAYSYYRLNITAINGAGLIQVSEWRLLDYF